MTHGMGWSRTTNRALAHPDHIGRVRNTCECATFSSDLTAAHSTYPDDMVALTECCTAGYAAVKYCGMR
jgi:hypothetical protein